MVHFDPIIPFINPAPNGNPQTSGVQSSGSFDIPIGVGSDAQGPYPGLGIQHTGPDIPPLEAILDAGFVPV